MLMYNLSFYILHDCTVSAVGKFTSHIYKVVKTNVQNVVLLFKMFLQGV